MAASKLDIWELLRNIDRNNRNFLTDLPEDQRKGFAPIVALRWLSGGSNDSQLLNLNELVNSTVFNLYKHQELLYDLMVVATPPGQKSYNWIKTPKKNNVSKRVDVLCRYLEASPYEAESFLPLYTDEDIIEMATALGETTDFIKQLKSEIK